MASAAAAAMAMPIEGMDVWAANNRKSFGLGGGGGSEHNAMMFSRRNSAQSRRGGVGDHHEIDDDEEALKWAALEKLPTYDRLRTSILQKFLGSKVVHEEVDVRHIGFAERQRIIDNLLKVADEDNERFLLKLRHRIDRVGIKLPTLQVRYENLSIDAKCLVGNRALPTLKNATLNFMEAILDIVGLSPTRKTVLNILHNVSGIIEPARCVQVYVLLLVIITSY
jgi:hypothetical protein